MIPLFLLKLLAVLHLVLPSLHIFLLTLMPLPELHLKLLNLSKLALINILFLFTPKFAALLRDFISMVAVATGAQFVSEDIRLKLDDADLDILGTAEKLIITKAGLLLLLAEF